MVEGDGILGRSCAGDDVVDVQISLKFGCDGVVEGLQVVLNGCHKQKGTGDYTKRNSCEPKLLEVVCLSREVVYVFHLEGASDVAVGWTETQLKEGLFDVSSNGDAQ